jgi:transcriptional regulator with XRE-family HTH domain
MNHDKAATSVTIALGTRLRALRREQGLSQEELAHEAGMDRSYVGAVERGTRNVSLVNLDRLSRALGMTLSQLFEGVRHDD